jgi:transposase
MPLPFEHARSVLFQHNFNNILSGSKVDLKASTVSRGFQPQYTDNEEIKGKIGEIYEASKKRYGCIKIKHALENYDIYISQNRVLRLMRQMGIKSIICPKYRHHNHPVDDVKRQNLLNRQFQADKPNQIWLTDITYIRTLKNGWTYLAVVLDMCTRKIIGYSYSKNMTAELATDALIDACRKQGYPKDVLLHSDQGSQYTSALFVQTATRLNMRLSYSAKGTPLDNSPMESFNSILKKEEIYIDVYVDFESATIKIFDFIEGFYNRNRIHSSIGFMSPVDFESHLLNNC